MSRFKPGDKVMFVENLETQMPREDYERIRHMIGRVMTVNCNIIDSKYYLLNDFPGSYYFRSSLLVKVFSPSWRCGE